MHIFNGLERSWLVSSHIDLGREDMNEKYIQTVTLSIEKVATKTGLNTPKQES